MNDNLIANNHAKKVMCQKCKKSINEPAFVKITAQIITNQNTPKIFTCPEQMFNYAQGIIMCATCWIETLREHETKLYDMDEVTKKYNEENKKRKEENK